MEHYILVQAFVGLLKISGFEAREILEGKKLYRVNLLFPRC